jgi:hypothetical protein
MAIGIPRVFHDERSNPGTSHVHPSPFLTHTPRVIKETNGTDISSQRTEGWRGDRRDTDREKKMTTTGIQMPSVDRRALGRGKTDGVGPAELWRDDTTDRKLIHDCWMSVNDLARDRDSNKSTETKTKTETETKARHTFRQPSRRQEQAEGQ